MKKLLYLTLAILPMVLKRFVMNRFLGWNIHSKAHISTAVTMCNHLTMGEGARIEKYTVLQGLGHVSIAKGASIGAKSRISGSPLSTGLFPFYPDRRPDFSIGISSALLNIKFDCQDAIEIGDHTTFAGRGSEIFTHGIDVMAAQMSTAPVRIGSHCMIGTGTTILKGVTIADRCVVGAKSVVVRSLTEVETLYAGSPAIMRRRIAKDARYFSHQDGPLT